ncbi:D-hexose-6-phosphate mutarotase [Variovorax sp. LT1R16]|uniref:D-hexose-6-phosphate mutarotase n=1 Tax=Variovorax sp. LT1R16 TaxID=3443728 RepID=UPI003F48A282
MSLETLSVRGQPAVRLRLPGGDACTVALHGAQLLSWQTADGVERIYLSPEALFDGRSAIRGGVPVCWPQFNQRGPLPKHGFARNTAWRLEASEASDGLVFALTDDDASRALWPHAFRVELRVTLTPGALRLAFDVRNTGDAPWTFTAALHTYLQVDDIADARLEGLQGAQRWDAVRDLRHAETAEALRFGTEFDSVYAAPATALRLVQPRGALAIAQSASCTETVVWNPGAALAAKLADLPDEGWRHMLCVEAACIDDPVTLAPGAAWQGWQQLTVL